MAIIQISKIQVRSGNLSDIPQLDSGEMGFAQDQRRLFIGNDANRPGDPNPNNTEILTQYSPIDGTNIRGNVAAGGSTSQIQYNSNGVLAGSSAITIQPDANTGITTVGVEAANLVFYTQDANGTVNSASDLNLAVNHLYIVPETAGNVQQQGFSLTLANVDTGAAAWSNVYPSSANATAGYVLTVDGANGTLSWQAPSNISISGNGVAAGVPGQIQINGGNGNFAVATGFSFESSNSTLVATNPITSTSSLVISGGAQLSGANVSLGNVGNLHITGGSNGQFLQTSGTGNLAWATPLALVNGSSNVTVDSNSEVRISSTGNANVLVVSGSGTTVNGALTVTGNTLANNVTVTGNAAFSGANVSLGAVGNLRITGGSNTQVLTTDGLGGLRWANAASTSAIVGGSSNVSVVANGAVTVSSNGVNVIAFTSSAATLSALVDLVTGTGNVNVSNSSVVTLGPVGNLRISGGTNGQVLTTNGNGNLSWATVSSNGGVQYGDSNVAAYLPTYTGILAGLGSVGVNGAMSVANAATVNSLTVNTSISTSNLNISSALTVTGNTTVSNVMAANVTVTGNTQTGSLRVTGTTDLGAVGNLRITGGSNTQILSTDGTGNVSWVGAYTNSNVASYLPMHTGNIGGNVITANAANVGAATIATANIANITVSANAIFAGITTYGNVANLRIAGGTAGYFLQTDGNANLNWGTLSIIANGTSRLSIPAADGNIAFVANGNSIMTVTDTGVVINNGNLTTTGTGVSTITSGSDINLQTGGGTGAVNVMGNVAITNRLQLSNAALLSTSSNATVNNKLAIDIGGTTYYILLSTSPM